MTDISALVNKRYNAAKENRRIFDRNAKLNLAFYCGKQWVVYDNSLQKVVEWLPNKTKPRPTINLIMPVVRQEYAILTSDSPTFTVFSSNAAQRNISKAKISHQFLDFKIKTENYFETTAKALLWAIICGSGFVKVYYDPNQGPQLNDIPLGDVLIDACSPLEIFPDPRAETIKDARWLIHARVRSVEYIEEKYGIKANAEQADSILFNNTYRSMDLYGFTKSANNEQGVPSAIVKEYWERPNKTNPEGIYAVVIGNKVAFSSTNPYAKICPIPFAIVSQLPVPGSFFGETSVTHLRPVNALYNKFRADILENAARLGSPPLFVPMGVFKDVPQFTPGEIIEFNPMTPGRIEPLQIPPYPPQLINTLMRLLQERDDISGLSEVSRGAIPRGLRTPEQFSQVLSQDMTRLAVVARNYENLISDVLNMVLKLAREFYEIPRLIGILGIDNQYNMQLFRGSDIPEDAQIFVEAGSTLAFTREQKQQNLFGLWDRQIITDPRLVLRSSKYGSEQELTADIDLDTSQAQRENDKMTQGLEAIVETYQNHVIHIVEHNRFRKTQEFENLPVERRQLWTNHVTLHEQLLPAMPPPPPAPIIVQAAQQGGVQVGQRPRRPPRPFR